MKLIFTLFLCSILTTGSLLANAGIFQSNVEIKLDGAAASSFHGTENAAPFDAGDPAYSTSIFAPNSSISLDGFKLKAFKDNGTDITSASLLYKFYPQGGTVPSTFTSINFTNAFNLGGNDQQWEALSQDIVLAMDGTVTQSPYVLELQWQITTDGVNAATTISSALVSNTINTSALPVSLTKFTATPQNDRVAIDWETEQELHNDFFTVERSTDGKTFNAIATVAGAGTTERSLSYSAYDNAPLNGTSYYRLRQTDFDGTTVVFDAVSVEMRTDVVINAYPNPVKAELTLELTQAGPVRLYDLQGRLVLDRVLDAGRQELSLDALNAGTYVLQAGSFHQTVIKQ